MFLHLYSRAVFQIQALFSVSEKKGQECLNTALPTAVYGRQADLKKIKQDVTAYMVLLRNNPVTYRDVLKLLKSFIFKFFVGFASGLTAEIT